MDNRMLYRIIAQAIAVEENAARLYRLFAKLFHRDAFFWSQMSREEQEHAAIFRRFHSGELPLSLFPEEIAGGDLERLVNANALIEQQLSGFLSKHRRWLSAYRFAVSFEELASEGAFQMAMTRDSDSESLALVRRIARDSKDHKARIEALIQKRIRQIPRGAKSRR